MKRRNKGFSGEIQLLMDIMGAVGFQKGNLRSLRQHCNNVVGGTGRGIQGTAVLADKTFESEEAYVDSYSCLLRRWIPYNDLEDAQSVAPNENTQAINN